MVLYYLFFYLTLVWRGIPYFTRFCNLGACGFILPFTGLLDKKVFIFWLWGCVQLQLSSRIAAAEGTNQETAIDSMIMAPNWIGNGVHCRIALGILTMALFIMRSGMPRHRFGPSAPCRVWQASWRASVWTRGIGLISGLHLGKARILGLASYCLI